ncbi:formylglycine-generating enzyme family protein [Phragmitibacter flavus]|uniref:Formylglycine-generating enzyme family protein n=1 Tax=Phragmitibacter flavus TaxID=2576071 RepID=A0A5R8K766_9BACT|nr:formylglycine-generating enzyme family protein [Phragmitibacter flavus]TLD68216.1 formylglycine-generating enzyme family protein [Phragmitibacter flavus]
MSALHPFALRTTQLLFCLLSSCLLSHCGRNSKDPQFTDTKAPGPTPEGMVWIPGGQTLMGSNHSPHESPIHEIAVDGFWMDQTEVTNAQFAQFVAATNYITLAERTPKLEDFPENLRASINPADLVPGALVFSPPATQPRTLDNFHQWWRYQPGANWRHPQGPGSSIENRMNHPVVCLAWEDANAYAQWAGKRLPTEAEWEYAARGGTGPKTYLWGEEDAKRVEFANTWIGTFPVASGPAASLKGTTPVKQFPPNEFGLHDMAGNVWEHVADWYQPNYHAVSPRLNPPGPKTSYDPNEPGIQKRVIKGGSWLCNPSYCTGYRPSARMANAIDSAADHTGFRCVVSAKKS